MRRRRPPRQTGLALTPEWLPAGAFDGPVAERSAVHNLQHGAVAVWYDADVVPAEG